MILWLWAALAQEPAAEPVDPPPDPAVEPMELTVWGEAAIRQSRAAVVREIVDLGWRKGRERDGQVVFKPPERWMGRAVLDYDGTLMFRRPVVAFRRVELVMPVEAGTNPHFDRQPGGLQYPTDDGGTAWAAPHPVGTFWILPSWDVLGPVHQRVRDRVEPVLEEYRAVVERTAEREGS